MQNVWGRVQENSSEACSMRYPDSCSPIPAASPRPNVLRAMEPHGASTRATRLTCEHFMAFRFHGAIERDRCGDP